MSSYHRIAVRLNSAKVWHRALIRDASETHITTRCGLTAPQDWWRVSTGGGIDCAKCKAKEPNR